MSTETPSPRLLGDVGGTNARFALIAGDGQPLTDIRILPTANYPDLAAAATDYLRQVGSPRVQEACIAIANPIDGDELRMTNTHWRFSIRATEQQLGLRRLVMLNDWEAMALALPSLPPEALEPVGGGQAVVGAPCGLIGPGTGLGVSSLVRSRGGEWVAIAGEGSHVSWAPANPREADILRVLWRDHAHVSVERVVSGMGLENLHRAITVLGGQAETPLPAAEITRRALAASDPACEEALALLCQLLGGAAGNLALTLGARGGIYVGGGIVGHLGGYFARSGFRAAFEAKGRFQPWLQRIPTFVIRARQPALIGAAQALDVRAIDV